MKENARGQNEWGPRDAMRQHDDSGSSAKQMQGDEREREERGSAPHRPTAPER